MVTPIGWTSETQISAENLDLNEKNIVDLIDGHVHDNVSGKLIVNAADDDIVNSESLSPADIVETITASFNQATRIMVVGTACISYSGNSYLWIDTGSTMFGKVYAGNNGTYCAKVFGFVDVPAGSIDIHLRATTGCAIYGHSLTYYAMGGSSSGAVISKVNWDENTPISAANMDKAQKVALSLTEGHDHDGTNSRLLEAKEAASQVNSNVAMSLYSPTAVFSIANFEDSFSQKSRIMIIGTANIFHPSNCYLSINVDDVEKAKVYLGYNNTFNGLVIGFADVAAGTRLIELIVNSNSSAYCYGFSLCYYVIGAY